VFLFHATSLPPPSPLSPVLGPASDEANCHAVNSLSAHCHALLVVEEAPTPGLFTGKLFLLELELLQFSLEKNFIIKFPALFLVCVFLCHLSSNVKSPPTKKFL
jgi:hypothetical protein